MDSSHCCGAGATRRGNDGFLNQGTPGVVRAGERHPRWSARHFYPRVGNTNRAAAEILRNCPDLVPKFIAVPMKSNQGGGGRCRAWRRVVRNIPFSDLSSRPPVFASTCTVPHILLPVRSLAGIICAGHEPANESANLTHDAGGLVRARGAGASSAPFFKGPSTLPVVLENTLMTKMSWQTLLAGQRVRTHSTSKQELDDLRGVVERDLADGDHGGRLRRVSHFGCGPPHDDL